MGQQTFLFIFYYYYYYYYYYYDGFIHNTSYNLTVYIPALARHHEQLVATRSKVMRLAD